MSQRDGFGAGFLAGALFGGLVGGVMGALIATKRESEAENPDTSLLTPGAAESPKSLKQNKNKKRSLPLNDADSIETARRSLEDKIAQLNLAIDDVRTQLGGVNGNAVEVAKERFSTPDNP